MFRSDKFCGLDAIVLISKYYGKDITRQQAFYLCPTTSSGYNTLQELENAFSSLGYYVAATSCDATFLANIDSPAVLFVDNRHFASFYGMKDDKYLLVNYPDKVQLCSKEELLKHWDGITLFVLDKTNKEKLKVFEEKLGITREVNSSSATTTQTATVADVASTRKNANTLVFEEPIKQIKDAKQYQTIYAKFGYVNAGKTPVRIKDVKKSCTCTSVTYTKDPIAPGERGSIRAEIDSGALVGRQTYTLVCYVDDEEKSQVGFNAVVDITKDIIADKTQIDLVNIRHGEHRIEEIMFHVLSGRKYEVSEVRSSSKLIVPRIVVDDGTYQALKLQVDISDRLPWGTVDEEVAILFKDNARPPIEIPIKGNVSCPITLSRNSMYLRLSDMDTSQELMLKGGVDTKVAKVTLNDDIVPYEAASSEDKCVRLLVDLKPFRKDDVPLLSGRVKIFLSGHDHPIVVPCLIAK